MTIPPIISLTDCTDSNAVARQSARLAALFGAAPTILPLAGRDPEAAAALTLLDVLRSTELLGGAGEPLVVLVNIAPRDGHWPNGVPFCYFRHRGHLIISTLNPRVLAPLRRYLGVDAVEVTDVREVLDAAAAQWAEFIPEQVDEIARTQFRSLWYVPLLARWLVDGRPVPSHREELVSVEALGAPEALEAGGTLGAGEDVSSVARVAVVDNFGNCKLDLPAAELPGYPQRAALRVATAPGTGSGTGSRSATASEYVRCYDRLPDVPRGEAGFVTGSSGVGFAELVVRGGSAAERFGLRQGDPVRAELEPAFAQ